MTIPESLRLVGTVQRDGRTLHHLSVPDVDWQSLSSFFLDENAGGFDIRQLDFDVFVAANALPHSAKLIIDGTAIAAGTEVEMTIDLAYRFSRFGEDFEIDAPTSGPSGPAG